MKIEIAQHLKAARMTQGALADAIGKSHGFLSEILSGKKNPSVETLQAMADALGVPVSAIIAGGDDTQPPTGLAEAQAEPFRAAQSSPIREAIAALSRAIRRPDTYRVRNADAALALCAGDVLIIALGATPAPGALVIATIANLDSGEAATIVRRYVPGWLFGAGQPMAIEDKQNSVGVLGTVVSVIRSCDEA